nr:class II aldolase/adducin family protein [Pseudomonas amygdali]
MNNVQQQIVDLSRHLSRRGFFAATGGNLALRIDALHIAVTPSATDYFSMRPEDVCVLRLKDLQQLSGERSPSVESELHAKVLRSRPDVNCSIHTHQPLASACTLFGKALDVPYPPLWKSLGKRIQLVGYAPSGSGWLAGRQARQGHTVGSQRLPDAQSRRSVLRCGYRNHPDAPGGPGNILS